ncbi:hypothetical protein MD273_13305 [Marinobacter pelagius]|uniref:hypothetical protein n=1 Tax=Marinobacter sp. C7 TaxID=2951363 RepID=UPI001EF03B88|nr:hypothetical protein [Marinobacter sp. C7]MCG7200706.1 hypothetical protein [Marinobacter sp. C7]
MILPLVVAVLAGCASINIATVDQGPMQENEALMREGLADCLVGYDALETTARELGIVDARHQRVQGFPYLRTSRFLASFDSGELSEVAYLHWLMRQNDKAVEGLLMEWKRLSPGNKRRLSQYWPGTQTDVKRALGECGKALVQWQAGLPRLTGITPDDQYQAWKRWVGLYPLAAIPFYVGVVHEHEYLQEKQREFADASPEKIAQWTYYDRQVPALAPDEVLALLGRQELDALGIPMLAPATEDQLLDAFMPSLAIQHTANGLAANDRPIRLIADASGAILRDASQPTIYTHISYGRYQEQITIQLNYSVWFAERRPDQRLDLFAGQFDGLTWRVHVSSSGTVLGYDKMHQCGCWYQFFPASGFSAQPELPVIQEPFNIGQTLRPEQQSTLWLESNTHYLLGVLPTKMRKSAEPLNVLPYAELRALARPDGQYHSPFNSQGLMPESRRPERFLFWPMGIPSPGAMRIHGTHAIAFIGQRHFDDPRILDELGLVSDSLRSVQ